MAQNTLNKRILVTGSSGFIGMHLCLDLLKDGYEVLGIDNMNNYYDINLKKERLKKLEMQKNFSFIKEDIINKKKLDKIFKKFKPRKVINLAAQAGVRHSISDPHKYIESNIAGFMNILECTKKYNVEGLIYASSSSVYGANLKSPFSIKDSVDKPKSIYGVTKRTNELMAYTYSHLYGIKTTGLRFFTVYGPWGRPDMAMYIFSKNIALGKPITVFNKGDMTRDFTYIDDIVKGVRTSISKNYDCEIFNLSSKQSSNLMYLIQLIEDDLGLKADIKFKNIQLGDVQNTEADLYYSEQYLNYFPSVKLESGILKFLQWFKSYNNS